MRNGPGADKRGWTKDSCADACADFRYFALQDGKNNSPGAGPQCFCEADLAHAQKLGPATDCGPTGNGWKNMIYE